MNASTNINRLLTPEAILQGMYEPFVYLDSEWRFQFLNDAAIEKLGKKAEELIGNTLWECFPEIDGTEAEAEYRKVMEQRIHSHFEIYIPRLDSWMEIRAYAHQSGIFIYYNDISDKKKIKQVIADGGKWFQYIADCVPVMMWSCDSNKRTNYLNPAFLQFTGFSFERQTGKNRAVAVFEDDRQSFVEAFDEAFEKRATIHREFRIRHHDGSYRWVAYTGQPMYDPPGNFIGYTGTCVDIHDQVMMNQKMEKRVKQRTLELVAALEQEKRNNKLQSQFVSLASHEFHTPLSTILSSVGLIESYIKLNQPENEYAHLNRIRAAVKHLTDTMNDFLAVGKLDDGVIELRNELFDLQQLAAETLDEFESIMKAGQKIIFSYKGYPKIRSEIKILRNMLANLLSNAIKYSDKNIQLDIEVNKKRITIAVADNGIGIPNDEHEKLFNKYFRASNVGNIRGTGLGLNIVQRYVELLNGTINFTSELGVGTTFIIKIPNRTTFQNTPSQSLQFDF